MADISKINAVLLANIAEIDDVLAANIAKVNGLVFSTAPAFTGLLDTYTGAAAAYSTRRLYGQYTGAALRVREDATDTETDISFDSNGDLDTAAIASHCGSANGYVVTWYGQESSGGTGSGNDAAQATSGKQPQIYNGTAVITLNGKPALASLTSNNTEMASSANIGISGTGDRTNFIVAECDNISGNSQSTVMSYGGGGAGEAWQNTFEPWIRVGSGYQSFSGTTANTQHLLTTALWSGTNVTDSDVFVDGAAATAGVSVSRAINTTNSTVKIAANTSPTPSFSGSIQEILIWASDQSSNRSGIEGNVNAHFQIGNFGTPTSGLLYDYSGAAAAYSVRQLANTAALAMRIREDGTDTELDIGFDSNGDLDTAAIASHCGANNGYVVTWYDQSGSQNDATQGTTTSQPQIYNGTAVITENGKPSLSFDGSGDNLQYSGNFLGGSAATGVSVSSFDNATRAAREIIWGAQDGTGTRYDFLITRQASNNAHATNRNAIHFYIEGNSQDQEAAGTITDANQHLLMGIYSDTVRRTTYNNGSVLYDDATTSLGNLDDATAFWIGADLNGGINSIDGQIQEIVIWNSDQEAANNRTGIETNINNYFSIY